MDADVGTTYDDGLVKRTVVEAVGNSVLVIAKWRGNDEGTFIKWKRDQWDEWFSTRKFIRSKPTR